MAIEIAFRIFFRKGKVNILKASTRRTCQTGVTGLTGVKRVANAKIPTVSSGRIAIPATVRGAGLRWSRQFPHSEEKACVSSAFAASLSAIDEGAGGVTAKGFPMTSCYVDNFPAQITIPMVVAFCAPGADYDPVQYIIATSSDGERVGALEFSWH
jgi:hypothetical protein